MEFVKRPGCVVSGMAAKDGRILMGKRRLVGKRPGLWELPGGKIDVDVEGDPVEHPRNALVREWKEELDLDIEVDDWLAVTPVLDLEVPFMVDLYHVTFEGRMPTEHNSHDDIAWFEPAFAVERLPCSPAFYLHYPAIRAWFSKRPR